MQFSIQQYTQALYEALAESNSKDHDRIINNFVEALKDNGDLGKYEQIIEDYEKYDLEQRGMTHAKITTAHKMEPNKTLLDKLNTYVGKKVIVEEKVDDTIIGGMVIRVDDTLIDGSIRTQLEHLEQDLRR